MSTGPRQSRWHISSTGDGRAVGAIEAWRRHGLTLTLWTNGEGVVNDVLLPLWSELSPRGALEQAIKTAEVLDRIVEDLSSDEANVVSAQRLPRIGPIPMHRSEHLDEIDTSLDMP